MPVQITSTSNERIKRLVRLRDRRHRDAEGVFVVEGDRLFSRAVAAGLEPREVYVTPSHAMAGDPGTVVVDGPVLDKVSYRSTSEGIVAVFAQFASTLTDLEFVGSPILLVAESIEKPGNLGAMTRTANAIGAGALVSVGETVDIFNPNVLRASTGAIFETPIVACPLRTLTEWTRENGMRLIATAPDAGANIWDTDLEGRVALGVGAEDSGHSGEFLEAADEIVHIPMSGSVDSLNAATSLAVIAYEALRQRSLGTRF